MITVVYKRGECNFVSKAIQFTTKSTPPYKISLPINVSFDDVLLLFCKSPTYIPTYVHPIIICVNSDTSYVLLTCLAVLFWQTHTFSTDLH